MMDSPSRGKNEGTSPSPSPMPESGGGRSMEEARPRPTAATPNFMGKHRMTAAISFLEQQIQMIQEELDQLETLGESSIVCREVLASVESSPDALMPMTRGPVNNDWDRWFQGGHSSRNRRRWI